MALKAVYDKIDDIDEPYRELYSERNGKFELTGIEGVKTQADVDRLSTSLVKERDAHKATKTLVDTYGALGKPEDLQAKLDRIAELEAAAAGKLDEEQINKLVEGRIKTRLAPTEREKAKLDEALQEANKRLQAYEAKERQRTVHDAVRAAAVASKIQEHAMEDVLLLAERVFTVDEQGKVVVNEGTGYTLGIEPSVWLSEIQPKRPHWWPASQGGGGRGPMGGGAGGPNPFSHEGWNLTEQGKVYMDNPLRAKQLAESAGTTIGGARPQPRK
jgi:hypothetical protein